MDAWGVSVYLTHQQQELEQTPHAGLHMGSNAEKEHRALLQLQHPPETGSQPVGRQAVMLC